MLLEAIVENADKFEQIKEWIANNFALLLGIGGGGIVATAGSILSLVIGLLKIKGSSNKTLEDKENEKNALIAKFGEEQMQRDVETKAQFELWKKDIINALNIKVEENKEEVKKYVEENKKNYEEYVASLEDITVKEG